jgi:hypothetical protein
MLEATSKNMEQTGSIQGIDEIRTQSVQGVGMYYNTTGLTGDQLKQKQKKNKTQNESVLEFFQMHPDWKISPEPVHKCVFATTVPLTSIRRAITDLTDDGYLEKTHVKVKGQYGVPIHCWRLKN